MSKLSPLVGQKLAGFELTGMLGQGGMAAVFRGENLIDRSILRAIKVVQPILAADEEFTKRFAEEARVLERLQHPNVVRFYGARWDGDHLLMELELLVGVPLSAKLRVEHNQPLAPVARVVEWIRQACEGLSAAHDLDIVHRDLKPDNLFLTDEGVVKVLDFGIARALDEADRASTVTRAGTAPGTPAYLAPEVCKYGVPSKGSDVYAMGMTLFELLLGYHPLLPPGKTRRSSSEIMFAHVQEDLPLLRSLRGEAPEALEQIVLQATAKDPGQRFATARELADVLQAIQECEEATEVSLEVDKTTTDPDVLHAGEDAAAGEEDVADKESADKEEEADKEEAADKEAADKEEADKEEAEEEAAEEEAAPAPAGRALQSVEQPAEQAEETPDIAVGVTEPREPAAGQAGMGRWVGLAVALVAIVAGILWYRGNLNKDHGVAPPPPEKHAAKNTPPKKAPPPPAPLLNAWITVTPAATKVVLGIDEALYGGSLDKVVGFRARAGVVAPSAAYELQQHEVTWAELDPWLVKNIDATFTRPPGLPDAAARKRLPATGVPWSTAQAYCRSLGGALPTEEQWEFAARGAQRRPNPWGASPLDLARARVFAGPAARPGAVMKADQDRTPGPPATALYDMIGNAREWTLDPYRGDETGAVESWVQSGGKTFRAIRGLPLREAAPEVFPREGAAYRDALCAPAAQCPAKTAAALQTVGFRCAKAGR